MQNGGGREGNAVNVEIIFAKIKLNLIQSFEGLVEKVVPAVQFLYIREKLLK